MCSSAYVWATAVVSNVGYVLSSYWAY
eukprot:SAG31_NODE_16281_length_715_cov_1.314935_1_plen_26_part_10